MTQYITEIWVSGTRGGVSWGEWLPVDGMEYTARENAIDEAARWEDEGYIARVKKGCA